MPTINLTPVVPKQPRRSVKEMPEDQYQNWQLYNSTRWRKLRQNQLMVKPLCELCKSRGFITSATEVHHIQKFSDGQNLMEKSDLCYDSTNLLSLCDTCHNRYHRLEKYGAHTKEDREFLQAYNELINKHKKEYGSY